MCRVFSCRGYCAPEYENGGKPSKMADVYSLGIIITELITGRKVDPNKDKVRYICLTAQMVPVLLFILLLHR